MKILILGAGKMGSFFVDLLSFDHETAVYDIDSRRLRFMYNTQRFTLLEEVEQFRPELVINAVTLKYTLDVFRQLLPVLPQDCILSDIASVCPSEVETSKGTWVHEWQLKEVGTELSISSSTGSMKKIK